ncbi:MAG: hypothetical protein V4534_01115 [Myxococcota bacterium]
MKNMYVLAILSLLTASGCASVPVSVDLAKSASGTDAILFQKKTSEADAHLIVIRDKGFVGSACKTKIFVNGDLAGQVSAAHKIEFWLPASDYLLAVQPAGICAGLLVERDVVFKANEEKIFRISMDQNGGLQFGPTMRKNSYN